MLTFCLSDPAKLFQLLGLHTGGPNSMNTRSDVHASVHEWAGGSWTNMTIGEDYLGDVLDFDTSPNDPLWWSHHAQLDRLHY